MPDIKVRVGQQNAVKVVASAFGGSLTAEQAVNATNVKGGIASVTSIINSGITTLTGPVGLGSDLYVAGISTLSALGGITTTGGDLWVGNNLYLAGTQTIDSDLYIIGIATVGILTVTTDANVGGAVTIGGTPAVNDICYFRIFRDVSDSNDDMTEDARLIGIKIFFTTDASNDA